MTIRIPAAAQLNATHCTANLPGYPAIDYMGSLGEDVVFVAPGTIVAPHLIQWKPGFGGWTFYFVSDLGGTYFVTHLDEGFTPPAGHYPANSNLGTLTRSAEHAALINGAHVHVGSTSWTGPGLNCGTAQPLGASKGTATRTTPHTSLPPAKPAPTPTAPKPNSPFSAWKQLTYAIGSTMPTQARRARTARNAFMRAVR